MHQKLDQKNKLNHANFILKKRETNLWKEINNCLFLVYGSIMREVQVI